MRRIDVATGNTVTSVAEQGAPLSDHVLAFVTSVDTLIDTPIDSIPRARSTTPDARDRMDRDSDVLDLVREGDVTGALQRLMQRHGDAVYRYCRTALNDAALADDVLQQVFVEVFRDLPRFAGRSTVRTWLLGIARHRVLDAAKQRRRTRARVEPDASADVPDARPSPGEALDDARLRAALVACIAELDEPVRTAILLRYQQGLTYEEMAEICDERPGTLHARVIRALRRLRDRIEARTRGAR